MNLNSIQGPPSHSLELAPELRRQAVGRVQAQTEAPSVPAEPLLPAGRHEKSGSFVHSLAFVIDEPPPEPQTFKKGIPVVQRLTIHWP